MYILMELKVSGNGWEMNVKVVARCLVIRAISEHYVDKLEFKHLR